MASTMDQFERQFENLDVQSEFVENAMGNQATLSTPEEDVNLLLQQARAESGGKRHESVLPRSEMAAHLRFDRSGMSVHQSLQPCLRLCMDTPSTPTNGSMRTQGAEPDGCCCGSGHSDSYYRA